MLTNSSELPTEGFNDVGRSSLSDLQYFVLSCVKMYVIDMFICFQMFVILIKLFNDKPILFVICFSPKSSLY